MIKPAYGKTVLFTTTNTPATPPRPISHDWAPIGYVQEAHGTAVTLGSRLTGFTEFEMISLRECSVVAAR